MTKIKWSFLLLLFPLLIFSQEKNISGVITDNAGLPLPGVSVLEKGTSNGALTDFDGKYSISASVGAVLEFSYLGMKTQTATVGGTDIINLKLEEDSAVLDEVVLIGYTEVRKKDLTGSVSTISSKDLVANPGGDALGAAQGQVAGAQIISNSGAPGVGFDIQLRGASSLSGGTSPLYVIDGVQIEADGSNLVDGDAGQFQAIGPLSFLNPDDIETMTFLKDANATAIYGSRGANGVIIITTKSGKNGSKSFNATYTNNVVILPEPIDVLNGRDYVNYRFIKSYDNVGGPNAEPEDLDQRFSQVIGVNGDGKDVYGPRSLVEGEFEETDYQRSAFRPATTQQLNLSFTSGNDNSRVSASLGYLKNDGLLINTDYNRITSLVNYQLNVNDKLKIRSNLNISYGFGNATDYNSDGNGTTTTGPIRQIISRFPIFFLNDLANDEEGEVIDNELLNDPTEYLNLVTNTNSLGNIIASVRSDYELTKNIDWRSQISGRFAYSEANRFYPNDIRVTRGFRGSGEAEVRSRLTTRYDILNTLNYRNRFWNNDLRMSVLLGTETRVDDRTSKELQVNNFLPGVGSVDNLGAGTLASQQQSDKFKSQGLSYFSRGQFDFFNKYSLSGTFRADGSSKFRAGNRWGYFYSVAGSWRISKENFLKNSKSITDLKLRASYGTSGNDRIPNNQTDLSFASALFSGYDDSSISIFSIANIENRLLTWESTAQANFGVDLELFSRVNLTADIYRKVTTDMLYDGDIPAILGAARAIDNVGRIDNEGLEIALSGSVIKNEKFSWNTLLTATRNISVIKDLGNVDFRILEGDAVFQDLGRIEVGDQLGNFYGYVYDGVYQFEDFNQFADGATAEENVATFYDTSDNSYTLKPGVITETGARPGSPKFKDLDGDGELTTADRQIIGNSTPDWYGGISNTFTFGKLSLDINMIYSIGNDIYNATTALTSAFKSNNANVSYDYYNNFWRPTRTNTDVPRVFNSQSYLAMLQASSYYIEDGSFLRLKRVNLSYSLGDLLGKYGFKNITVFATGFDLLTLTGYSGFDPEVRSSNSASRVQGVDRASYPRAASVTLGVNVQL